MVESTTSAIEPICNIRLPNSPSFEPGTCGFLPIVTAKFTVINQPDTKKNKANAKLIKAETVIGPHSQAFEF